MLVSKREGYSTQKTCQQCGRYLNDMYHEDICPSCKEMNLFSEVKEYIRENDVKENDVAEHFGLSIGKVRSWIREGRIQYRGQDGKTLSSVHCQICGKPIDFGTLCSDCHRMQGFETVARQYQEEKSAMRFLGTDKQKRQEEKSSVRFLGYDKQ